MSFTVCGKVSLSAWNDLLFNCSVFYPMFWNSVVCALLIASASLFITVLSAFGIKMLNSRITKCISGIYLFLMMLPLQVMLLPVYLQMRELHLLNTQGCIIIPEIFTLTGMVLMNQYIKNYDISAIEAARLETSSSTSIIIHILLPDIKQAAGTVFVLDFIEGYTLLEQPLLFLKNDNMKNLTVFIAESDKYSGNIIYPASVLYMIPAFLIFLLIKDNAAAEFLLNGRDLYEK